MLIQCAIPVFEGLLPELHNTHVLKLLFDLAHWHGLAKLQMHTVIRPLRVCAGLCAFYCFLASVILIIKHFETFFVVITRPKGSLRVVDKPHSDNYASNEVMHNTGSWIQNGTSWA